jgi:ribosomal protein S15P/S13E
VVGITEPAPIPEKPVISSIDPVDAAGLCRRLLSSRRALANLPREARRLARWYQRRRLKPGTGRISPLRIGRPPGGRKRAVHAVDDILKECQALALDVLDPPNTS